MTTRHLESESNSTSPVSEDPSNQLNITDNTNSSSEVTLEEPAKPVKLRFLNDTDFTYLLKMSPETGIQVKLSINSGKSFKTVFNSQDDNNLLHFVKLIPQQANVHFAVWDHSNDDTQTRNGS